MVAEVILARGYFGPDVSQVDAAHRIALDAIQALARRERVGISMDGVLGAASSFFNVILLEVAEACGPEALTSRLDFTFTLKSQESVYRHSLAAVLKQPR